MNVRQATRRRSLEAEPRTWIEGAATDVGEQVTERVAVLRALAGLSEADTEILTLTTWHSLSTTEAAEVLGCTKAAFFVRLHRARRRLQSAIDATGTTASRKPVTVPGAPETDPTGRPGPVPPVDPVGAAVHGRLARGDDRRQPPVHRWLQARGGRPPRNLAAARSR